MKTLTALLLWAILLVLCWPLALLLMVVWPILWLLSIPFRVVASVMEALLALVRAIRHGSANSFARLPPGSGLTGGKTAQVPGGYRNTLQTARQESPLNALIVDGSRLSIGSISGIAPSFLARLPRRFPSLARPRHSPAIAAGNGSVLILPPPQPKRTP